MVEVSQLGITEVALGTCDAGRADHIDEAIGMLVDEADALLAGLWGNHHDDTDVILVSDRLHHLQVVIEWKVWDDSSAHATLHTTLEECLDAIMHDRVEITHQYQWDVHLVLDGFQLTEEGLHGHAVLQGFCACALDDWSICQWVAEWDADFYHVDAVAFHRLDDSAGAVEGWATCTEVERQ